MYPKSTKAWALTKLSGGPDGSLKQIEKPVPELGPKDVLVRIKAVSLNYRDLALPNGLYPFPANEGVVATSDGAGEVVAVGSAVSEFKTGDKVATVFNQGHQYGPLSSGSVGTGLGGALNGALAEYAVFPEHGVVSAPKNLSFEEAATLPCAALTAWNALYGLKPLKSGENVLIQGTGGVSIFALQFAKIAGAFVVATTSSDEKAKVLKELGADAVINYKTTPDWGKVARSYTPNSEGFDHVVEIGGPNTLAQSFEAIKYEGVITMIGFVGGVENAGGSALDPLGRICTVRGVFVGSRQMMLEMNRAIEVNGMKPVVDKTVFNFEDAKKAYAHLESQKHIGKVVIRI